MKSVLLFVLSSVSLIAGAETDQPAWEPEKTWVFAVGVIQYDDPTRTSWPDEGRVDVKMIEAFRKRGVPERQIVFLKNKEGTKANITEKLPEFVKRPAPGDTLVFYYTGHGSRDYTDEARTHTFVTYDTKSKWTVSSVVDTITKNFRGSRVILTADCCHSGSLGVEAEHRANMPASGVLTSSRATSTSTGNWTFTQCLVDMLDGKPALDLDHDGRITFREASTYTNAEMAFSEDQSAGGAMTGAFPPDLVMAKASEKESGRVGERCEGLDKGAWYKAKIISQKDGKFFVTWPGWDKKHDAWLTADQLRPYSPIAVPASTKVEIEWQKRWYPGSVIKTENGLHLVHYDGYPDSDDEWVSKSRLRVEGGKKKVK